MSTQPELQTPDVSVALLTRNAGATLERLLHAVAAQRTKLRVEIVAVDSGSDDETPKLLKVAGARIVTIAPESFNFGLARDLAFETARGAIVVSLSQDAIPAHTRWLENLLYPLENPLVAASCGRSIPDPKRPYPQFPWERNGYFYFTREMKKFRIRYGRGLSNANSAIRRGVWERVRFGEQSIGEDYLFQTKLHAQGLRIAFPNGAEVLHHHDYTLKTLWNRCRNEGLGLREMGCPYTETDLLLDLVSPAKYVIWFKELLRGRLQTSASLTFPVVRPIAVYAGSRFGKEYLR